MVIGITQGQMAFDRARSACLRTKPHRSSRCTAIWLCAQLMLLGCCHGFQGRANGLMNAVVSEETGRVVRQRQQPPLPASSWSHSSSASIQPNPVLNSRQLRSAMAAAAASEAAASKPGPGVLPYPREASAVQRYLDEALQSNTYTTPVWFVVVVDPNNVAATNVTTQQLEAQIKLLNRAYMTGLPGAGDITLESGELMTRSTTMTMVEPEGPVAMNTVQLDELLAHYSGPERLTAESGSSVVTEAAAVQPTPEGARNAPHPSIAAAVSQNVASMKPLSASKPSPPQQQRTHPAAAASNRRLAATDRTSAYRQLWRFQLKGIKYTTSSTPMCVGSSTELGIKKAWRANLVQEGGTAPDGTLVIYVSQITSDKCKGVVAGYSVMFGFGTSPFDLLYWKQRNQGYRDGVVMDPGYLWYQGVQRESGSGAQHGASSGAQLVHEVGHWFGLQHTFAGGCTTDDAQTDQVDDTPAEALPTQWGVNTKDASSGCAYRDTCGSLVGPDMYYNYMDYMNLACARSFTAGQQARMLYLIRAIRRD